MDIQYGKSASKDFIDTKINWDGTEFIKSGKKLAKSSTVQQKVCYVCGFKKGKIRCSFYGINYIQC